MGNDDKVLFRDCVVKDDKTFFFPLDINVLCGVSRKDAEIEVLCSLYSEDFFQEELIQSIFIYKTKVLLVPSRAKENVVYSYDIKTGETNRIKISGENVESPYEKYSSAYLYDDKLILVGCYQPIIVIIDIEKQTSESFDVDNGMGINFLNLGKIVNGWLYLPSAKENKVLKFNLLDKGYEWLLVGNEGNSYCGLEFDGDKFWLVPWKNNCLVEWDGNSNFKMYDIPNEFVRDVTFYGTLLVGRELLIAGNKGFGSCWFDVDQKKYRYDSNSYVMIKHIDDANSVLCSWEGQLKFFGGDINFSLPNKKDLIKSVIRSDNTISIGKGIWNENNDSDFPLFLEMITMGD